MGTPSIKETTIGVFAEINSLPSKRPQDGHRSDQPSVAFIDGGYSLNGILPASEPDELCLISRRIDAPA
jgi:hypothetical protein